MISKKLFMTLGLSCLLLAGCQTAHKPMPESSTLTSTGYASEEVQLISLYYDGTLYLYNATGFDLPKEESWELLGQVAFVNNLEFPTDDFCGTHLNVGQEVYRDPKIPQKLYVKYDSGFALFEAEETKKEESTEYLDYVTAGIELWTSDSLELKLTNVSNETISYGEAFTMEVLHDGIWEKLPVVSEEYGFNDILYELEPGEYRFIDIDFAWLYGELHEGWFRIIKEIYLQDGTVYSVPAEFGDLDLRQTEGVNPKEVLDNTSIASNVEVKKSNIKIDYGTSSIYTKVEMDAAIELIKKEFSTWDGCELHSISYSTDDECSESNIAWMNEMEKATDAEETLSQCIMFKSNFHSPLNGGSGFNPDEEYTDWQWWLARSEGGQWKLMTYGY